MKLLREGFETWTWLIHICSFCTGNYYYLLPKLSLVFSKCWHFKC